MRENIKKTSEKDRHKQTDRDREGQRERQTEECRHYIIVTSEILSEQRTGLFSAELVKSL